MRRVATSWKVIESVLQENAHSAYRALRPPAPLASIRALEKTIGVRLPRPLVTSLRIHDGMPWGSHFIDSHWLLSTDEMAKWWRICVGAPWQDPGPRFTDAKRIKGDIRWRDKWVPIAVDLGGNLIGVDLDPGPAGTQGQVFPWKNYGDPPSRVIAPSFAAWMDSIASELLPRHFTLDQYGRIDLHRPLARIPRDTSG